MYLTNTDGDDSIIKNSAIHDCVGECMNCEYTSHVIVENNVFYNGEKFLLETLHPTDWVIQNNLFIAAKERPDYLSAQTAIWDPVALLYVLLLESDPEVT